MKIMNPVLPGFNPDPSIVRVGEDYYMAVSTFEWFPGVHIYHSKDLANWEFIAAPLNDDEKMDLTGIDTACGIWAPNLTYANDTYYLAYTIVYTNRSRYKDTHNFIITAKDIKGPWSEPVYLNCSGFDPSLFHDDDKKWFVNMTIDHRITKNRFSGIDVQEYDHNTQKLVGPIYKIFKGTEAGTTEAPNIIKRNGWYYLTVAEGGTGFGHCATIARSRNITGPYEVDPNNPMLSASLDTEYPIQRAGHGQLVETPEGKWYMAHLCSRPINGYSILGRESALQNIEWTDDGWFRIAGGGNLPKETFEIDENLFQPSPKKTGKVSFDTGIIPPEFMTLRKSAKNCNISATERQGYLRIHGGNSLASKYKQGLLARRQQSFSYDCTIKMDFNPKVHQHMAGLVCYYNYDNYHYLKVSHDEVLGNCINITTSENKEIIDTDYIALGDSTTYYLKAQVREEQLNFYYSFDGFTFNEIGPTLSMIILSDEHVEGNGFTGAMVGMCCQDLLGDGIHADFEWFEYKEC